MINLGETIKSLRKQKNISQEVLANYLGVSFQAVSKWENGSTLPDVQMIPALATFFNISTDELLNLKQYQNEKNIESIVNEYYQYCNIDKKIAEEIIRNGLKKYPGNEILLNYLLTIIATQNRNDEVITVAKMLIENTTSDKIRLETYCILAEAYSSLGKNELAKEVINHIPDICFTKYEIAAKFLKGDDMYNAAITQKFLSLNSMINMLVIIGKYWHDNNAPIKAISQFKTAQEIIAKLDEDIVDFNCSLPPIYEQTIKQKEELERLLSEYD